MTTNVTSGAETTRVSSSCSTSGIRRDGDSGILEGCVVPTPLVAFVVMVIKVFSKGK
jgi:hypothetical protein